MVYGLLNKVSIIDNFHFSGTVPVLGVGFECGFANGFGVRTEITWFDSDGSSVSTDLPTATVLVDVNKTTVRRNCEVVLYPLACKP